MIDVIHILQVWASVLFLFIWAVLVTISKYPFFFYIVLFLVFSPIHLFSSSSIFSLSIIIMYPVLFLLVLFISTPLSSTSIRCPLPLPAAFKSSVLPFLLSLFTMPLSFIHSSFYILFSNFFWFCFLLAPHFSSCFPIFTLFSCFVYFYISLFTISYFLFFFFASHMHAIGKCSLSSLCLLLFTH